MGGGVSAFLNCCFVVVFPLASEHTVLIHHFTVNLYHPSIIALEHVVTLQVCLRDSSSGFQGVCVQC